MMKAKSSVQPQHIAIIMDGNGRWAEKKGLPRVAGHRAGVKTLRGLIEHATAISLQTITVYAFSRENWQRPKDEVHLLMDLFMRALDSEVADLHDNHVCLKFIGHRSEFNDKLQAAMNRAEALTASNSGLRLNIAANYSGRWDIVQACQAISADIVANRLQPSAIDEATINAKLALAKDVEPDLFIRTGGEQRISNYLLWQMAYTELYFTDTLWPDFKPAQFDQALDWFSTRQRRFGKTSAQIQSNTAH